MKKQFLKRAAVIALLLIITLAACDNPASGSNPADGNTPKATERYETVPYDGKSADRAASAVNTLDKLVYSAYDDEHYYYLFLLGHVNRVPLAYRPAIQYDGRTPITIGYSSSNVTEETISHSVEEAFENSVTESTSYSWGVEVGASFGTDAAFFKMSVTASAGGEYGWDETNSRSQADTYETARTVANEITDSFEITIGENDESAGLYRYSLFATTDVYYVLITDKTAQRNKFKGYSVMCARPQTYWGVDYEPNLGGSFGKTAPGDLLSLELVSYSTLPEPTENDIQPIPAQKAEKPVAANQGTLVAGGTSETLSYETQVAVTLSTATNGAHIYYTLNGTTPTVDSMSYQNPIIITSNTTLKAIAIHPQMDASEIMTQAYTITEQELQTTWSVEIRGEGINRKVNDNQPYYEYLTLQHDPAFKNFDKTKLAAAGYTSIYVEARFDGQEIDDGYAKATVRQGHTGNGAVWAEREVDLGGSWQTYNFTGSVALSAFTSDFTYAFTASGVSSDWWWLGIRTLKFTAKKPGQ